MEVVQLSSRSQGYNEDRSEATSLAEVQLVAHPVGSPELLVNRGHVHLERSG
jgi:hypothetical protein